MSGRVRYGVSETKLIGSLVALFTHERFDEHIRKYRDISIQNSEQHAPIMPCILEDAAVWPKNTKHAAAADSGDEAVLGRSVDLVDRSVGRSVGRTTCLRAGLLALALSVIVYAWKSEFVCVRACLPACFGACLLYARVFAVASPP